MTAFKRSARHFFTVFMIAAALVVTIPVNKAHALCETNAEVAASQTAGISSQLGAITTIIADMQALVASVLPVELLDLVGKITNFSDSLRGGMGDMWGGWHQNMRDQTAQLNTAIIDQSRNMLAAQDAVQHNDRELADAQQEVAAAERTEVNEFSCTMDTVMPHLTETQMVQTGVANAMTEEFNDELLSVSRDVSPTYLAVIYNSRPPDQNMTPIPASFFNHAYAQGRARLPRNSIEYDRYLNVFCNILENGGQAPCRQSGTREDDDIEISRTLFGKDTLDIDGIEDMDALSMMEDMIVLKATVDNLTGRPRVSPTPASAMNSYQGQESLLEKRASVAHLNVSQGIYWDIIGERMPSLTERPEIAEMRVAAGVPENETSDTPSKYELRQAFIEYVNSPPFVFSLKGGAEKMVQNDLHLKALRLMMINDLNRKMERMATLFSVQLSNQLSDKEGSEGGN